MGANNGEGALVSVHMVHVRSHVLILYICKCVSLTSQKRERWFDFINNNSHSLTNMFHIGWEHSTRLKVVARQHKNNGVSLSSLLHVHAAAPSKSQTS